VGYIKIKGLSLFLSEKPGLYMKKLREAEPNDSKQFRNVTDMVQNNNLYKESNRCNQKIDINIPIIIPINKPIDEEGIKKEVSSYYNKQGAQQQCIYYI
jgi:hypothetical protein